jgi:hypothetical protein
MNTSPGRSEAGYGGCSDAVAASNPMLSAKPSGMSNLARPSHAPTTRPRPTIVSATAKYADTSISGPTRCTSASVPSAIAVAERVARPSRERGRLTFCFGGADIGGPEYGMPGYCSIGSLDTGNGRPAPGIGGYGPYNGSRRVGVCGPVGPNDGGYGPGGLENGPCGANGWP